MREKLRATSSSPGALISRIDSATGKAIIFEYSGLAKITARAHDKHLFQCYKYPRQKVSMLLVPKSHELERFQVCVGVSLYDGSSH